MTATARFPPRVIAGVAFAVFETRFAVTVVVTRVDFFGLSIENFSSFTSLLEILITSTSSLSAIVPARRTFSALRKAGPAGRNCPPSALRAPYCV